MNAKIGGILWKIPPIPGLPNRVMTIGIDVCHEGKMEPNSYAGFCASLDASFTKYYSKILMQKPKEEIVNDLALCFVEALRAYFKNCAPDDRHLPEYIVIYRDGVSDGQKKVIANQ